MTATLTLALGLATDFDVVITGIAASTLMGSFAGAGSFIALVGLSTTLPYCYLAHRRRRSHYPRRREEPRSPEHVAASPPASGSSKPNPVGTYSPQNET